MKPVRNGDIFPTEGGDRLATAAGDGGEELRVSSRSVRPVLNPEHAVRVKVQVLDIPGSGDEAFAVDHRRNEVTDPADWKRVSEDLLKCGTRSRAARQEGHLLI